MDLAARIRMARAKASLSQQELGEMLGHGKQTQIRRERGEGPTPSEEELRKLAYLTGLPYTFFTMDFGAPEPAPLTTEERLSALETIVFSDGLEMLLTEEALLARLGASAAAAAREYADRRARDHHKPLPTESPPAVGGGSG